MSALLVRNDNTDTLAADIVADLCSEPDASLSCWTSRRWHQLVFRANVSLPQRSESYASGDLSFDQLYRMGVCRTF